MSQLYATGNNVIVEISKVAKADKGPIINVPSWKIEPYVKCTIVSVGKYASEDERLQKGKIGYVRQSAIVNTRIIGRIDIDDEFILSETLDKWTLVVNRNDIVAVEE